MMRNSSCSSLNSACSGGEGPAADTMMVLKKGPWTAAEDAVLMEYVQKHGEGNWNLVQKNCGLARCGKSCRLRWANHLRPNLKKGSFTPEEEMIILQLHVQFGNKWARMATQLPGRTDNEIKNFWNTRIKRRQRAGLPLYHTELQIQQHQQQRKMALLCPPPNRVPPSPPSSSPVPHSPLSSPLSLFRQAPLSSSAMPVLLPNSYSNETPEAPRLKRIRGDGLTFQFPLSPAVYPPVHQMAATTATMNDMFEYNVVHSPRGNVPIYLAPPMIAELPSTQLFNGGGGDGAGAESGCRLLEALLQEAQGNGDPIGAVKYHGGYENGSSNGKRKDLSPCSNGINEKREQEEDMNPLSIHDDMSKLFDIISNPSVPAAPEWYNNTDSCEMSNGGQSSAVADDELGLELQHLASSLSITPADQEWNIGSCTWSNMPGIC